MEQANIIHLFIPQSVLRQLRILFQSESSADREQVLPVSSFRTFSFN